MPFSLFLYQVFLNESIDRSEAQMAQELLWTTLWVDSIDRKDWLSRVQQVFDLPGVDRVLPDRKSGQVRVRYNPETVTMFQLSAHLRASGL